MAKICLETGCYLIRYKRTRPYEEHEVLHHEGTLRITRENEKGQLTKDGKILNLSGDLYSRPLKENGRKDAVGRHEPGSPKNIPIFPRNRYRFYLQGLDVAEEVPGEEGFLLRFRVHEFDHRDRRFVPAKGDCAVVMKAHDGTEPEAGFEDITLDYYQGAVINEDSGEVVGTLTMGRLCEQLRRAEVEIDSVAKRNRPLDNQLPAGSPDHCNWQKAFAGTGWEIKEQRSNSIVPNPAGRDQWTVAELHQAMVKWRRQSGKLDERWHYHLLCVPRIEGYERGLMYDAEGGDAENIPHEGAAIASDWEFPEKDAEWKEARKLGETIGQTPAYFRCAVHEIGHAMGLEHDHENNGFMNTTDAVAAEGVKHRDLAKRFPANIEWSFSAKDQERLRHGPDVKVRPGTQVADREGIFADKPTRTANGLNLHATSLLESVPLGAPVRIHLRVENTTGQNRKAPRLSLKSGHLTGKVTSPSGRVRTFLPLVLPMDGDELAEVAPGATDSYAITLLRGSQGPLFPIDGSYQVAVELAWDEGESISTLAGECSVRVTPAVDKEHEAKAKEIFSTPETLLSLAIGGHHLKAGNEVIDSAIENKFLGPHFAFIKAKRLASRFRVVKAADDERPPTIEVGEDQKPEILNALKLLDERTVLSVAEIHHVADFITQVTDQEKKSEEVRQKIELLKRKVDDLVASGKIDVKDQIVAEVDKL